MTRPRAHPHPCAGCTIERQGFCRLPDSLLPLFENLRTTAVYEKGSVAFDEAEPCHGVFIVCDGKMKLVTTSAEGKVLLLRFALPGEVLGLVETVLGGTPFHAAAIAAERSVLAVIPGSSFLRFVRTHPEACLKMVVELSQQYKAAQREARFLAFGENSTARLARLFLDWSSERGMPSEGGVVITSHLTHTELAQTIGSTRETVTRILGDLHHRGIVERRSGAIVIRDPEMLGHLAQAASPSVSHG